jgi:hypothetical protein
LVLNAFFMVLLEVEGFINPKASSDPIHPSKIHGPWQEQLSKLRDQQSHSYRDPESLQAAQVLSKMGPIRIYRELENRVCRGKVGGSVGNANETLYNKDEWYIEVAYGEGWLVECAILGLSHVDDDPATRQTAKDNLEVRASYGLEYGSAEVDPTQSLRLDIFGPNGVLWDAMERFTRNPDDQTGITDAVTVVMHQAMHNAGIFIGCLQSLVPTNPSYKWYAYGLIAAKSKFVSMIEDQDPKGVLSFAVRDVLKDIHFPNMWEAIWQQAVFLVSQADYRLVRLHFDLYIWILNDTKRPSSDPRPWMPDGCNVQATVSRSFGYHLVDAEDGKSLINPDRDLFSIQVYPLERIDIEWVEQRREPRHLISGWGSRSYPDVPRAAPGDADSDSDDEEEDDDLMCQRTLDDEANLKVYGPLLDPIVLSEVVTVKPIDQVCTICMEDHFHSHVDGRTLKVKTCGNYFHLECVRDWLKGPSPNSNLCRERRVQFSGTRRHVRPIQPSVQPSVQPPGRPSVATAGDSLSDDSEDRLSSVDLITIGLAVQPLGRPSVAAPLGILPDDSEDSWTSDDFGSNYSDLDLSGSDDSSSEDSDSDSMAPTIPTRRLTEADLDELGLGSNLEMDLDAGPQPDTAQSDAQHEPPA